jgi:galactofuranose transport system permease protein
MNAIRAFPLMATMAVFVAGYAFCAMRFPAMLSARVIGDLLTDNAYLGVLTVGMTFVVISGGIDLSVGAVMGLTSLLLAAALARFGLHPIAAFALALIFGAAFGAGMGAAIHYLEAPAFIVTLTAMFLARGLGFLITTEAIPIHHPFYDVLTGAALPLPGGGKIGFVGLLMIACFIVGGILLHGTRFGANVFALGGAPRSAKLMGVHTGRVTVLTYAISGTCAALAGIVMSIYTQAAYPLTGVGTELDAIAAVVIGGTLLSGGVGGLAGSFFGVLIQGLILTYIDFDGTLSSWWSKIVIGVLLFAFIAAQRLLLTLPSARLALRDAT